MKQRQRFTKEFKLEAVRLLERGDKPAARPKGSDSIDRRLPMDLNFDRV